MDIDKYLHWETMFMEFEKYFHVESKVFPKRS